MKLIKVDGYWIILSNEKIKKRDFVYYFHNSGLHKPSIHKVIKPNYSDYKPYSIQFDTGYGVQEDCKKIIYSQNPEHNLPSITFSDEVDKVLGIVDIKKKAMKATETLPNSDYLNFTQKLLMEDHYIGGYNQALSDNEDKLFTLEQMESCFFNGGGFKTFEEFNFYIQSITKKEYDCELEIYEPIKNSPSGVDRFVKITNNSVKVIKIIK